jgi:hypothetical protein
VTVATHNAQSLSFIEGKVYAFKQDQISIAFVQVFDSNHGSKGDFWLSGFPLSPLSPFKREMGLIYF